MTLQNLPYSRVVNVQVNRVDNFPTRRGFGIPIFLTSTAKAGEVDADNRTKVYGSLEEVAIDWDAADDFYKAANQAFAQNPRPLQIKVGYINALVAVDAAGMKNELDAVFDADQNWYWADFDTTYRDGDTPIDGAVEWFEAKSKMLILTSNDPLIRSDGSNTTSVAGRHKNTVERTAVYYDEDAGERFAGYALGARLGTFNFDEANTRYTAKFKSLQTFPTLRISSSEVENITSFTPGLGQGSPANGNNSNCHVSIGDEPQTHEGSTLTPNVFIDEIHASDWIIARTEEEVLAIFLNNASIPMDDRGMETLAHGPRTVMQLATRAGLVAKDRDPETGAFSPAYEIFVPSVYSVPASQRKNRIAPEIIVRFRYAGSVHHTTVKYEMIF